uniref:high choriolytic enzyme 2-like n=1 Tax=Monopterus albus TaxID=43700 RepID=UPI0009B4A86E
MMIPVFLLALLSLTFIPSECADSLDFMIDGAHSVQNSTMSSSKMIERTNVNSSHLVHGDIKPNTNKNAVPCTATGCKWPKSGSYVIVPVAISADYTQAEVNTIVNGLVSFHSTTCIRFVWRTTQTDFLYFFPGT